MKKQTGKIKVECLGRAASEVTQSIYQLTAGDRRIILDYGLYQSSDLVESYKVNHSVIKEISPKKIDFIIVSHANIDHCGALHRPSMGADARLRSTSRGETRTLSVSCCTIPRRSCNRMSLK